MSSAIAHPASRREARSLEAVRTYESHVATYLDYEYELVPLPLAPVEERVRFVRDAFSW
ncbi:hypothetical protein OG625_37670 [Streptomyces sp. NBC_01351]|uniref:hypothetical protein n=1 Tax=Streptomyces sp. NBC_01351 TaxID=2903833 RepID=UPI002E3587E8|nr:hypothetical protein [Streptomyces sp. NBC_01351]